MSSFLQLAVLLIIILVTAKASAYLSTRIGQTAVFGELVMGVILGPSLINLMGLPFLTDAHLSDFIAELGELGVLLLMFLAGLELHLKDLTRSTRVAAFSGVLGVLLPVGLGIGFGELTGMDRNHAVFLGLTLGATSVSISAQVLIELKQIRSKVGLGLLGAAVFDDILVLLILSAFLALLSGDGGGLHLLWIFVKMVLFLALSAAFGIWVLPWLTRKIKNLPVSQSVTTFALVILLVYGLAAELLGGMAAITGTFLAGLMFNRTSEKELIETNLQSMAYSFFVPIFFIGIGINVNLRTIDLSTLWLLLGILVIAVLGKVIGAGGGALAAGYKPLESLQLGIGMISRGEVGLIIAKIGLDSNYLSGEIFTAIVAMILITTLITPPLLRASFSRSGKHHDLDASALSKNTEVES